jgi:serine/threonine-protein kinase
MNEPGVNLLDMLDELRDLPPQEQEQKMAALPAASREQLRSWLKVAQKTADPFEAVANALAGADPELLSKLRSNLSQLRSGPPKTQADPPIHTTQAFVPQGRARAARPAAASALASSSIVTRRKTADGRLAFQAGDVLLRQFRIVCQLGRGGMGEVFRAIDEHAGEQVALKFLPANRMANPEALNLLKSEVRNAHLVRSPYVCALHGLYMDNEGAPGQLALPPFIAMQFIEGEDLHTLLKRVERLSGPKVVRIAHELVKGMSAIHAAGILHRDLKPANVMLDVNGTVQILDFGIASVKQASDNDTQVIAGTPAYMAPEARSQPATVASDIYALGLLLFELTTGQMASRVIAEGIEPIQILEQYKDQVPRELIDAIAVCLRANPAERFQSMDDVLRALPVPAPARSRTESISTIAKSDAVAPFQPWAIAAVLAFIIIAGIGVFQIKPKPGSVAAAVLPVASAGDAAVRESPVRDPTLLDAVANSLARFFGAADDPATAHGFAMSARPVKAAPAGSQQDLYFWYRSSKAPLEPANAARGLTANEPPMRGVTTINLSAKGELLEAWRQPEAGAKAAPASPGEIPAALRDYLKQDKRAIGEVILEMKPIAPTALPAGWTPPAPFAIGTEFWMQPAPATGAAARPPLLIAMFGPRVVYMGRPVVSSGVSSAPGVATGAVPSSFAWLDKLISGPTQWLTRHTASDLAFWWMFAMPVLGLGLALRNIRLRRCDTRHALRVAAVAAALSLLGWILMTHPAVTGASVRDRWNTGVGLALFVGAQAWISYAAVDPYARLTWKRCLIGYARFTSGWPTSIARDAIVGRSILTGVMYGLSLALLLKALDLWSVAGVSASRDQLAATLLGDGWRTAGLICRSASSAIVFALLQFVTLVLLHWLTRQRVVAIVLFCMVTPMLWAVYRNDFGFPGYLIYPVIGGLTAIALIHEGVLTMAVGLFFSTVLTTIPFSFDGNSLQFASSVVVLLILVMIVIPAIFAVIPSGVAMRWWPSDPIRVGTMDPLQREGT